MKASHPITQLTTSNTGRRDWHIVWILTFAAACLRLWNLGAKSLWMDEGATVALARMSWQHFAWVWWRQEANMTTYYLLMRPWLRMGMSEVPWIRLPSVTFGVASIPVLYLLARRLLSRRGALFACALLACSPVHIEYSQEARSYSLTIFMVLLSSLFFVRAVEEDRAKEWTWWVVFSVLAVYSHYFAALVLVSQAASVLILRHEQIPWKRFLTCSALIALLAGPGIAFVLLRGPTLPLPWIPKPSLKELLRLGMFLAGSGPKFVLCGLLWTCGIIAMIQSRKSWGRSRESWRDIFILLWALLPVAITFAVSLHRSVLNHRYLLICLPATVMLAALGADWISIRRLGVVLVAALCIMSTIAAIKNSGKSHEDWRAASNSILSSAQPGDAVVFFPFYSRIMLDYYQQTAAQPGPQLHIFAPSFYGAGEDERDLLRAIESNPEQFRDVWVALHGTSAEQASPVLAAKLNASYGPPTVREFAGVTLLEFRK